MQQFVSTVIAGILAMGTTLWSGYGQLGIFNTNHIATNRSTEESKQYPFVLPRPSSGDLKKARQSFADKNSRVCAQVEEFGMSNISSFSRCPRKISTVAITNQEQVITQAKQWIVDNAVYTNVQSVNDLAVVDVMELKGCRACNTETPDWYVQQLIISFAPQTYHGLPFAGLSSSPLVLVWSDANGVWMASSNWYPDISVTTKPKISEEAVRKSLVGVDIQSMNAVGQLGPHVVTKEEVSKPGHLAIYVKKNSDGLVFYLAWGVRVESVRIIYFDALTGEKLGEEPLSIS